MAKFKKPPGPPLLHVAVYVENGVIAYAAAEPPGKLSKSIEVVPYVPEWEREKWKNDYIAFHKAGENQDEKFEDALIAVQTLVETLETIELGPDEDAIASAVAKAKELAPGAWIIKRDEIEAAEDG